MLRDNTSPLNSEPAFALADLLESIANDAEVNGDIYALTSTTVSRAVKVADAILGGGGDA